MTSASSASRSSNFYPIEFVKRLLQLLVAISLSSSARAEWRTEQYPVKAGWNAIYSFVDATHTSLDEIFLGSPDVEQIWRWQPEGNDARLFDENSPVPTGREWAVWIKGDADGSDFNRFEANYGYLVRMKDGASDQTLSVVGKPTLPEIRWRSDRAHLVGFPVNGTGAGPRFRDYLKPSGLPISEAEIFSYNGGAITPGTNPRVVNPSVGTIERNKAYWINLSGFSRFVGPLDIASQSGSDLNFGEAGQTSSLLLTNLGEEVMSVSVSSEASSPIPSGQAPLAGEVPLLTRLGSEASNTPLSGPRIISLAPGDKRRLTVVVDRQSLGGAVGDRFGSVLRISVDGVQDVFLSVSAEKTSMAEG